MAPLKTHSTICPSSQGQGKCLGQQKQCSLFHSLMVWEISCLGGEKNTSVKVAATLRHICAWCDSCIARNWRRANPESPGSSISHYSVVSLAGLMGWEILPSSSPLNLTLQHCISTHSQGIHPRESCFLEHSKAFFSTCCFAGGLGIKKKRDERAHLT